MPAPGLDKPRVQVYNTTMFRPKHSGEELAGPNDLAEQLWGKLLHVHHLMLRRAGQLFQQYGITPPQYFVMKRLAEGEILTQQELAQKLRVTKGNVSQMLKLMERKGLIERTAEGASKQIVLTGEARALLAEIGPAHTEFVHSHLSALSQDEQAQLGELLERLENSLR
jgi:DNA-binding MarR family transcriptional regulator